MKQLIVFSNPRLAQAFVDYMALKQIKCQLGPAEKGVGIWLADESRLSEVQAELDVFLKDPLAAKYQAASWQVAETRTSKFYYGSNSRLILGRFLEHAGPVTLLGFVLCTAIYLFSQMGWDKELFEALRFTDQLSGITAQPWRLVTPILLHFSILHIVFNLLWWWQLGGQIEKQLGSYKLVLVTLVAAIIPNVAQFYTGGPYFGGLSGVVYALLGFLWWTAWLRPQVGLVINKGIVGLMLVWLVMGFFDVIGPPIANAAHLAGLMVGCAQAFIDKLLDPSAGPRV